MSNLNGGSEKPRAPLELSDVLSIETNDGSSLAFEVVGIVEDPEDGGTYAVLCHQSSEADGDFIVTDLTGELLEEDRLAQAILDEFLTFAQESGDRSARNGEKR